MIKRKVLYFAVVLLAITITGCTTLSKQDTVESTVAQPLWDAGSTRDKIIVLSDLHTGFEDAYAEILENRPYLIEFLQRTAVTQDVREVVLNGDILDEWFLPLSFVEIDREIGRASCRERV